MKASRSMLAGLMFCLAGCGPNVKDYAGETPKLDIRQYLNGDLEAWGVFYNWKGKADPRFYVKMKASWQGNDGQLAEDFTYSDGHTQHREWKLTFSDDNHFIGTASDVIGTAVGAQYGNALNFNYVLRMPVDGKTYDLSMDDWMYLVDDTHLINRTKMKKFGFKVGELVISFRKM